MDKYNPEGDMTDQFNVYAYNRRADPGPGARSSAATT